MSLTPQALRLITREAAKLRQDPPEGVRIVVDEDDLSSVEGWVQGPEGTPYEGGYFRIKFEFGLEYPNVPPKCTMLTKIFHPNISKTGEICVDTLKKGWNKKYGVGHVLVTIKCLLIYPNPESALDEEAGKQLLADYQGYRKYANLITSIHATPKTPPPEFTSSTSSGSRSTSVVPAATTASDNALAQACRSASPAAASACSASAPTSTPPSSVPPKTPLGQSHVQERSPVVPADAKMPVLDKIVKPVAAGPVPAVPATKTAKPAAKRGVRRL